jgi:hypothetical protein
MAKKKKSGGKKKGGGKKKYRRKNPSGGRAKKYARAAGSRLTSGLNIKGALKELIPLELGALAARFAKNKGTPAPDLDIEAWTWQTYAKTAGASLLAGMVANLVKPGSGHKVMLGGLFFTFDNLIRRELIERSEWAVSNLGAGESDQMYVDSDGNPYYGELPLDERHRMLPMPSMGDALVPVGPLGDSLVSPGPLGDSSDFARWAMHRQ